MSVQERWYMSNQDPAIAASDAGAVVAKSRDEAASKLMFACPTKAADGKWYRVTLAISNVPVQELYAVFSRLNAIADRIESQPSGLSLSQVAAEIRGIRDVLKSRDMIFA